MKPLMCSAMPSQPNDALQNSYFSLVLERAKGKFWPDHCVGLPYNERQLTTKGMVTVEIWSRQSVCAYVCTSNSCTTLYSTSSPCAWHMHVLKACTYVCPFVCLSACLSVGLRVCLSISKIKQLACFLTHEGTDGLWSMRFEFESLREGRLSFRGSPGVVIKGC